MHLCCDPFQRAHQVGFGKETPGTLNHFKRPRKMKRIGRRLEKKRSIWGASVKGVPKLQARISPPQIQQLLITQFPFSSTTLIMQPSAGVRPKVPSLVNEEAAFWASCLYLFYLNCIYLKYVIWCFDKHIHSEMTTKFKLLYLSFRDLFGLCFILLFLDFTCEWNHVTLVFLSLAYFT
jgi:hypothetical protein